MHSAHPPAGFRSMAPHPVRPVGPLRPPRPPSTLRSAAVRPPTPTVAAAHTAGGRAVLVGLLAAGLVVVGGTVQDAVSVVERPWATAPSAEGDHPRGLAGADGRDVDDAVTDGWTGAAGRDLDDLVGAVLPWPGAAEPRPAARTAPQPAPDEAVWDRLAQCESSGAWDIATGNGYFGGLQFDTSTWRAYGGTDFAARPDEATREEQILVATRVRDDRGDYGAWPACARKLGLPG